ncbi:Stk1 family PASTA domain-containing Ser/Thr kinase [Clostridium sp. AF32-12BH]|uniref:Stk1 family PASTA domain-containing Ser/Thr kinase n=1 Tax=Clostridium sp. AF32-12BH TaxID=2292006 RepID=UPI000E469F28|nr:Stk1 family PASTA domain-containing Ser/Thr kinase [Clostridium sp. AF32-12BH]RHP48475.1 Stk1 family PASTA domain-containing Ser/Thr kinase [Clostridium sp. AF32-12BH]
MILRPGTFLQDRYEILEQIGSGGMSVVYKAKCHKLNRLVAIKVLKEEFCNDSSFVSKFKMEAQSAAGLSHPNIVSVYDVIDEGKLHYIVMELIEGITLKSYIQKKGRLEVKESIGIAIQVAQGIAAAHEQHIIHRDIKPQNMIISKDGKVKVADFGIARAVSAQTMTSSAMGSVHYISPEQARGGFSDERSDIYSLGVTMYEMVTGQVPFEGDNTVAIAIAHLENAVVPPSVYNPEIPVSLERIILTCMEKKPERRYRSAQDVIMDLRDALIHPSGERTANQIDAEERALNGETVQISSEQLSQIKHFRRPERMEPEHRENYDREAKAAWESYQDEKEQEKALPERERKSETTSRTVQKRRSRDEEEDRANPHIERILAGAGIVAAIVVVAVLIVVFSKLGAFFKAGSGILGNTQTESAQTESGELILKDTEVSMPPVLGMTEDMAESTLKESSLTMKRTYEYFDDVEKGHVAKQDPEAGSVVLKGGQVNVVISNGTDKLDLGKLGITELDETTAVSFLESKGLHVQVTQEENETIKAGTVMRYEPELVADGGTVYLYVSSGPHVDKVPAPYLVGKTEEEAIALLAENDLMPGNTSTESSDTVEKGSVISQSVTSGTQLEKGSKIDYVVSSGPEVKHQRYVASINQVYDLSNLIGPGAGTSSVTIMIRLRQGTADDPHYKVLTQSTTIKGDVLLPVNFTSIESMDGTDQGSLEIVDVNSGAVIKTYPLTFFPMD